MKLPDITAVTEYLAATGVSVSVGTVYEAIIAVTEAAKKCKCTSCKCDKTPIVESLLPFTKVNLASLSDNPAIRHELTESDNEIFVKSVDVMKDACGTGRVELLGRSILMNICESENTIHANFDIEVDGKKYSKVPFVVRLTEGEQFVKINKKSL